MLLDSNIIIYSFQRRFQHLQMFMKDREAGCSAISIVETLGYPSLSEDESDFLKRCFETLIVYPITHNIIQVATQLRQRKKMSLGDAIIAATAVEHRQTLATRNTRDFDWIEGLKVVDPLGGSFPDEGAPQ
ncbi:MAG: type II toxin-antitoxin system VapC family toxin [Gammaproteobacteria bacterium]